MKRRILTISAAVLALVLCTSVYLVLSGRFDAPAADPQGKAAGPPRHSGAIEPPSISNSGETAPAIPKSGHRYLPVVDAAVLAAWHKNSSNVEEYSRLKVNWILREIFSGVTLPASAHSFDLEGFKTAPKDAVPFFERLVAAVTGPPDPDAPLNADDTYYTYDQDRFDSVEVRDARGWSYGRRSLPQVLDPGQMTIRCETKLDPKSPTMDSDVIDFTYFFAIDPSDGAVFFNAGERD